MPTLKVWDGSVWVEVKGDKGDPGEVTNADLESRVSPIEGDVSAIDTRVTDVEDAAAPLQSGFANQKQLVPDGSVLGWFDGPVMVANWAPYKAAGDDATLVHSRLQSFVDDAGATKIPAVILPGTYRVEDIVDVPSNTTLYMHGATLLSYDTRVGNGLPENGRAPLRLVNAHNVLIEGGLIDGRKDVMPHSEFKHGVEIRGDCQNITIRDLIAQHCKGDGFLIGRWTEAAPYAIPRNIVLERVIGRSNYRQGMSITHGMDITVLDSIFEGTSGTPPEAGVDIEPNNVNETVWNITFARTAFRNNAGAGVLTHPGASGALGAGVKRGYITFVDGEITGNGLNGVSHSGHNDLTLERMRIADNEGKGVHVLPTASRGVSRVYLRGGTVRDNGSDGVGLFGADGADLTDVVIDGMYIARNGRYGIDAGAFTSYPIRRLTVTRSQLGHPDGSETQQYGLRLGGDHVTAAVVTDNRFGNATNRPLEGYSPARVTTLANNAGVTTRSGGTTSVANGQYINHGLGDGTGGFTPTRYGVQATVAGHYAQVVPGTAGVAAMQIRLREIATDTAVTTAEPVLWWAEV